MRTTPAGIAHIKKFEGVRLKAYKCPAGVWTIGVGHTSEAGPPPVTPNMLISDTRCDEILMDDLEDFEDSVDRLVRVPLTANQNDVLISFVFNVGHEQFARSTLLRKLNAGDYASVPAELMKWTKAREPKSDKRVELPGLVLRRRAEAKMWRGLETVRHASIDEARARPEPLPSGRTMLKSKEGNAAVATGALAAMTATNEAIAQIASASDGFGSLLGLLKNPNFLLMCGVAAIAGAIWYWRKQRMDEEQA